MPSCLEFEQRVAGIVEEIKAARAWPGSAVLVQGVLLQRYGVQHWSQLLEQLQPPSAPIRNLLLLAEIERKLELFLTTYESSSLPSICTYLDLDRDAANMLRSFSLPSVLKYSSTLGSAADPNQIDLDNEDEDDDDEKDDEATRRPSSSKDSFEESFGLGPLYLHPRVRALFNLPKEAGPALDGFLCTSQVLSLLIEFRRQTTHSPHPSLHHTAPDLQPDVDIPGFISFLLERQGVASLAQLGVVLRGSFRGELGMVREVEQAWQRRLVQAFKEQTEPDLVKKKRKMGEGTGAGGSQGAGDAQVDSAAAAAEVTTPFESRMFVKPASSISSAAPEGVAHFGSEHLAGLSVSMPWAAAVTTNPASNENVVREVGRWGEALVYQFLLKHYPTAQVDWVNRDEETRAAYDIIVTIPRLGGHTTIFVEVKSTRFPDLNVFELSLQEWDFATSDTFTRYHIYRVFNAGDAHRAKLTVVTDVKRMVEERAVKLCLAV